MEVIVVILLLVKIVSCQENFNLAHITRFFNDNTGTGNYNYDVRSSDGQHRGEKRTVLNPGTDFEKVIVEGYYSYLGPDGIRYTVGYTADENGFHPEGEHLPGSADTKRRRPQVGLPPDLPSPPRDLIKKAPLQSILGTSSG